MSSRPVVLVTGAARRIGREIALHLAQAGYSIALHYRASRPEAAEQADATAAELRSAGAAYGIEVACFEAELDNEAACRALVPAVVAAMRRLDVVVNNASTFEYDTPARFGHSAMERHWRANTAPAVLLTMALHAHLSDCSAVGCVVNLSDQKLWNPNPDYFSYTLSKAALEAATVMLAQACAPQLRVVGVAPGVTLPSGPMSEGEFTAAHTLTPMARSSTPLDIARTVHFLIESPAITGTTLLVDGGQHLHVQPRDVMFIANPERAG